MSIGERLSLFAFCFAMTVWFVVASGPLVTTALRTGRLLARGVIYDREANPVMFRLGIAFWIGFILLFGTLSVLTGIHLLRAL